MKKSLSLVLAIAMVFSMFSSMAFAGENQSAGDYLKSIGVIKGTLSGDLQENDTWSRQDVTVILSRLMGVEADAEATAKAHTFADVENPFYDGYISWAKTEGLFNGHSDVRFGYGESISNQQFLAVMTRALGYNFDYNNVVEEAIALGLVDAGIDASAEATRGSYYNVVVQTLHTVTADGQVLGNKLELEGFAPTVAEYAVVDSKNIEFTLSNGEVVAVELEEALVANTETEVTFEFEGTEYVVAVTWEVEQLEVVSASGTNLKEIVVAFNTVVDKANVKVENFTVGGANAAAVALSDDKMSVTVTIATPATSQPADYKLVVKKAVGLEADYSSTVRVLDSTIPVATNIELTGPTTFTVTFSEPINTASVGTVLVENGVYGSSVAALDGSNKINVTLASALTEGNYKIKLTGYKDFANYPIDTTELNLAYVKDASAVTASIDGTPSQTTVKVKFNKKINGTLTVNHFYHTFTAWTPNSIATTDNQTYTLTFTTHPIPQGTFNVVVKKTDGTTEVKDAWGNKLAADATLTVDITADTTAPTVSVKKVVSESAIELQFSEAVDDVTSANLEVKNSKGDVITATVGTVAADNTYPITLNGGTALPGGAYTILVKDGITDQSLSNNKLVAVTLGFTITDKTPATATATYVDTAAGSVEYIYVTFSEDMDVATATDKNNYRLGGAALHADAKVEMFGSNSKVRITLPDTTAVDTATLEIGQIADAAGNKIVALSTTLAKTAEGAPAIKANSVKTKSLNTVELVIDKVLTGVTADAFTVTNNTYADAPAMVSFTTKDGESTVTLTLTARTALSGPDAKPASVAIVVDKLTSDTGMKNLAGSVATAAIKDGVAPSFSSVAFDLVNDTATLTFNEDVTSATSDFLGATDLVVTYDGKVKTAGADYNLDTTAVGNTATVSFNFDIVAGKVLKIETKESVSYLGDAAGNKANKFSKETTL